MALETGTYISDLVTTNPPNTDGVAQADDHLRLIKSTVKATFPNITGAVTPTHTELNYVDGVTSAIQTQLDAKAPVSSPTLTGVPAAPTAAVDTNTTQLATTAYVVGQGYLKSATAASTYLTSATAASTYLPSATAASTYLTSATASSTYLPSATAAATYATIGSVSGIVSATSPNVLNATAAGTAGAVGTYALLRFITSTDAAAGTTHAGSALYYANANGGPGASGGSPAGTWRLMGATSSAGQTQSTSVWLRIS